MKEVREEGSEKERKECGGVYELQKQPYYLCENETHRKRAILM